MSDKLTSPQEFAAFMALLEEGFRTKITPGFFKLAYDALGTFKPETLNEASGNIIAGEERFPAIATIRRYCSEVSARRNTTNFNEIEDLEAHWRSL